MVSVKSGELPGDRSRSPLVSTGTGVKTNPGAARVKRSITPSVWTRASGLRRVPIRTSFLTVHRAEARAGPPRADAARPPPDREGWPGFGPWPGGGAGPPGAG